MATLEETLAAFGQAPASFGPQGLPPGPEDEIQGNGPLDQALLTLQQFGAALPQSAPPPAPPPMPVGPAAPAAPMGIIPPEGLGPLQPGAPVGPGPGPAPQPVPQFVPPKPPATLAEADQQQSSAIGEVGQSLSDATDAKFAAQQARDSAVADVHMRSARLQEELQNATIVNRKRLQADADLETASWVQDLQDHASREPNPSRWWENKSRLGKALWAIGLVFGAAHAAQTPGARNAAMETVRAEMNADMEEQRQRLGRELNALKMKGETMKDRQARNASDLRDDYAYGLTRIEALERAFMARATVPGDLDAAAMKEEAKAAFAQLKLPYVDGYRKEKLAEKAAAEARRFERQMLGAKQSFERQERVATQEYQTKRDAQKFQYDLALSPVSTSASYTPGGEMPVDKDGRPLYAEMQAGPAAGVFLKKDGKLLNYAPRFKDDDKLKAAGEVVEKANVRYTNVQTLLNLLESKGDSLLDQGIGGVIGTTDPELRSQVVKLAYSIAKEHDTRVSNADFSLGGTEGVGFDPDGKWLDRLKFQGNIDEIKAKLRKDLGAMPKQVAESFRKFNDAAINGQGVELVWDPNMLAGEKAPPERSSYEVRGEAPPEPAPITGVQDYRKRKAEASMDPEQKHNLPDHDSSVVDKFINETEQRGPSHVAKMAEKTLADIDSKYKALAERVAESSGMAGLGRKAGGGRPMSQAELDSAMAEMHRLRQTGDVMSRVAEDATKKAQAVVDRVTTKLKVVSKFPGFVADEAYIRRMAKEEKLGADAEEIEKLVKLGKELAKRKNKNAIDEALEYGRKRQGK